MVLEKFCTFDDDHMVQGSTDAKGRPLTCATMKSWVSSPIIRSVLYFGESFYVVCNDKWLCKMDLAKYSDNNRSSVFYLEGIGYEKIEGEVAMTLQQQKRFKNLRSALLATTGTSYFIVLSSW